MSHVSDGWFYFEVFMLCCSWSVGVTFRVLKYNSFGFQSVEISISSGVCTLYFVSVVCGLSFRTVVV